MFCGGTWRQLVGAFKETVVVQVTCPFQMNCAGDGSAARGSHELAVYSSSLRVSTRTVSGEWRRQKSCPVCRGEEVSLRFHFEVSALGIDRFVRDGQSGGGPRIESAI